jgi:hypothetical protein
MGGKPVPLSRAFLSALSRAWSVFGSRLYGMVSGFVGVEDKKKFNQLQTRGNHLPAALGSEYAIRSLILRSSLTEAGLLNYWASVSFLLQLVTPKILYNPQKRVAAVINKTAAITRKTMPAVPVTAPVK